MKFENDSDEFTACLDHFATSVTARSFGRWKDDVLAQGFTPQQVSEIVYRGSLQRGENIWGSNWCTYLSEITLTRSPGKPFYGHHLVEMRSRRPFATKNRELLEDVGIVPLLARENLFFVPLGATGQHGEVPQRELFEMLREVAGDKDGIVQVLYAWAVTSAYRE